MVISVGFGTPNATYPPFIGVHDPNMPDVPNMYLLFSAKLSHRFTRNFWYSFTFGGFLPLPSSIILNFLNVFLIYPDFNPGKNPIDPGQTIAEGVLLEN